MRYVAITVEHFEQLSVTGKVDIPAVMDTGVLIDEMVTFVTGVHDGHRAISAIITSKEHIPAEGILCYHVSLP